jgi:hypothetical protein
MATPLSLSRQEVIDVILAFHAQYDRAMRQDEALGLLMIAGAFRPGDDRADTRPLRVGAQMCGMVRDDVYLDTFSGKMRLLASSNDAARLRDAVKEDDTGRYILARWNDAAGRVWYRIGNHTRAMMAAREALELAEREPTLWWCWADIRSNLLRMQQEADAQVKRIPTVVEADYDHAIDRAERFFCDRKPSATTLQQIEHLRGLWNLHHNRMVTRGPDHLERSLIEFDEIARMLAALVSPGETAVDPYRQAQTVNQEAFQLKMQGMKAGDRSRLQRSVACYESLRQMAWPRGRFFARQHLPHLHVALDSANRPGATRELVELCGEVQREQAGPGGREGFDLDRYYWTVDTARAVIGADAPVLREHDLAVSRAIQAIASVSAYKNAAQRFVLPSLQREVERYLRPSDAAPKTRREALARVDAAIALIEEGSARELLDLLSTRRAPTAAQRAEDVFVPVEGFDPADADQSTARAGAEPRTRRASLSPASHDTIVEAVARQQQQEEAYWLANPLPTHGVDPDISYACRQFTADRFVYGKGPCLIRFFQRAQGDYWAVAYFKGDTFGPIHLVDSIAEGAPQVAELTQSDQPPRFYHCVEMWNAFFEPVIQAVTRPADVDQLERFIVVPSGELFAVPLHVAAVPTEWTGTSEKKLLCQWRPLCFSISLASHVLRNRAALRSCTHAPDDDLLLLFAGETAYKENIRGVFDAASEWPGGLPFPAAGLDAVRATVARKPEFFVLQCHGDILRDPQAGSVLLLHGGVLSNFGIATRQWLPRNKVSILGACLSGRPARFANDKGEISPAGEIAGFIRGFIAAGCGALFVTPWSVRQRDLGLVTEQIIRTIRGQTGVIQLDSLVRQIFDAENALDPSIDGRIEQSVFQLFL